MALTEYQKQRCLKVMDSIQNHNISRMFMQPVNPITDDCPDYFTKIKHPMDLSTSRKKLEEGQYENVEQWKKDIDLIWDNAITYNGPQALISLLARELQDLFKDLACNISSDLSLDWNNQFEKLKGEFNQIVKSIPKPPQRQQKISRSNSSASTAVNAANHAYQNTQRSQSSSASKTASKAIPSNTESTSKDTNSTNSPLLNPLTPNEIQKLSRDLAQIEDPDITNQIIDLVNRLEPQTASKNDDDDFVLEVEKLKDSTLVELRNMVSRILSQ